MLLIKNNLVIFLSITILVTGEFMFPLEKVRSKQSANCANHQSNLAHDGKLYTFSCSLNNPVFGLEGAWWEGDLGSKKSVTGVTVFHPNQKYYSSLMEKYGIYICNESISETNTILNCIECSQAPEDSLTRKGGIRINCVNKNTGQYVVLFKRLNKFWAA